VSAVHPWDALQQAARHVVSVLAPARQRDDVTLLLARMIGYRKGDTATLRLPARYDTPARARAQVLALLSQWRTRDDTRDKVVLLVSELVTNAVRFAAGPITVRLIRTDNGLLCEVGDTGNGRPCLRRGDLLDDGGRGLSVVHRLTTRWGVRWTDTGKVVWAEVAR
jgi:anti-sigma regulatory factor (Ser/Thr protein kinase)